MTLKTDTATFFYRIAEHNLRLTFAKSDINSLSEIGFAPMNFRVGNVRGGFGVVGCCSQISSGWIPNINAMPDYDNIDDGIRVLNDWLVDF